MKISKLFHWLYALVMLLPIFAIGVTCGYAIFNKNAYQSYADYVDTNVVEVSLNSPLINGQTYYVNITSSNLNPGYTYQVLDYQTNIREVYSPQETWKVSRFQFEMSDGRRRLIVYDENNQQHNYFNRDEGFYFVSNGVNTTGNNATWYTITTLIYTQAKVSEVFYYAIDKVQESPLFNWAFDNFLLEPISYVTSIFDVPQDSIINEFLDYWVSISVIWLCFDVLMFVPLLVHKEVDKMRF